MEQDISQSQSSDTIARNLRPVCLSTPNGLARYTCHSVAYFLASLKHCLKATPSSGHQAKELPLFTGVEI